MPVDIPKGMFLEKLQLRENLAGGG